MGLAARKAINLAELVGGDGGGRKRKLDHCEYVVTWW